MCTYRYVTTYVNNCRVSTVCVCEGGSNELLPLSITQERIQRHEGQLTFVDDQDIPNVKIGRGEPSRTPQVPKTPNARFSEVPDPTHFFQPSGEAEIVR